MRTNERTDGIFWRLPCVITLCLLLTMVFGPTMAWADGPGKWALVIGIDYYSDTNRINSLVSAAQDARAIAETLKSSVGVPEDHITLLIADEATIDDDPAKLPTRSTILSEMTALSRKVKPGDSVFVFYSGHGMEIKGQPYLLPCDADAVDQTNLKDTSIAVKRFRDRLRQMPADVLILALDMCRSAPLKNGRDAADPPNLLTGGEARGLDFELNADSAGAPRAVVTMFSCSEGQRSFEWTEKRRSFFLACLDDGLKGKAADKDGNIRLSGLIDYVKMAVPETVRLHEKQEQNPQIEFVGAAEKRGLILARKGSKIAPLPDAPVSAGVVKQVRLRLILTPPDATVYVDGEKRTENPLVIPLEGMREKQIELGVQASGYRTRLQRITITATPNLALPVVLDSMNGPKTSTVAMPVALSSQVSQFGQPLPAGIRNKINPIDGAEMVYVPPGEFMMGSEGFWASGPRHKVLLDGYWIYRYHVTVAMYMKFCRQTGHEPPTMPDWGWFDNHPIVNVTYHDAEAYAKWAGVRLPTEAEWEKAAAGPQNYAYPWGNEYDASRHNIGSGYPPDPAYNNCTYRTMPVTDYLLGQSGYGVMNQYSNLWEMMYDWFDAAYYQNSPVFNPKGPALGTLKATRIGPARNPDKPDEKLNGIYGRNRFSLGFANNNLSFRCVSDRDTL